MTTWRAQKVFQSGPPTLWAAGKDWEALEKQGLLVPGKQNQPSVSLPSGTQPAGVPWVFVPTYNRYHAKPNKQMLLDWADAMPKHYPYVRFIVIRPLPDEITVSCGRFLPVLYPTWCVSICLLFLFWQCTGSNMLQDSCLHAVT